MKNYFIRRVVLFFFFFFKEGKWSYFVGNILVEVKDISTYKTIILKKMCIYLSSLVFFINILFIYLVLFLDKFNVGGFFLYK